MSARRGQVSIGLDGDDGGFTMLTWAICAEDAAPLIAEFRERIGEPDVEAVTDEAGLLKLGAVFDASAVISDRNES